MRGRRRDQDNYDPIHTELSAKRSNNSTWNGRGRGKDKDVQEGKWFLLPRQPFPSLILRPLRRPWTPIPPFLPHSSASVFSPEAVAAAKSAESSYETAGFGHSTAPGNTLRVLHPKSATRVVKCALRTRPETLRKPPSFLPSPCDGRASLASKETQTSFRLLWTLLGNGRLATEQAI